MTRAFAAGMAVGAFVVMLMLVLFGCDTPIETARPGDLVARINVLDAATGKCVSIDSGDIVTLRVAPPEHCRAARVEGGR